MCEPNPGPLHGPELRWHHESEDKQHYTERAEGRGDAQMLAPPDDPAEHEERSPDGKRELAALGRRQSSGNSVRQSPSSFHAG